MRIFKKSSYASSALLSLLVSGFVLASSVGFSGCNVNDTVLGENYTPTVNISYNNSVVTTEAQTVLSGNYAKVTLSLLDTNFNPYIVTNVAVTFQASGGTSTGVFSSVTNNNDGTYSANFMGVTAGSPTSIQAFVNGNEIQSTAPTLQVLSGNYSLTQSTIAVSSATDIVGLGITATLTVRDSVGNPGSTGLTVLFSNSGGTSAGSFGATTDHGDGTYSATFTGSAAGSATSIHASIQGNQITSALPSVTVIDSTPSGLSYSANPAVYTKGQAIVNNTPSNAGGPINSYSISPSLPGGLSFNGSTGVISGTPTTLQGATSYTVTGTNTGGSTTATITITVNDAVPSALTYSVNPATYTKGTAIASDVPSNSGGSITGYSISPALPAGLNFSVMTGIISGTPTAISGATNYTVTASNTGGSTTATLSLTVLDIAPTNLTYTTSNAVYTKGTGIAANSPSSAGGPIVSYSVSPALPTGLNFNTATGVITGTPTAVSAGAVYTVTANNSGGSITGLINITVQDVAPSGLTYSNNPVTFTKGSASTDNPSNSGGSVTSYSVSPALPSGLSLNTSTGVISGTPSVFIAATNYTVTATNSGGTTNVIVSITINDVAPSSLTYSTNPAVYTKNAAITNNTPANSGGTVVSYAVSPALPAGLNFNTSTGVISGTPTAISGTSSYTVTATNTGGSTTASVSITVNDIPPSTLTYSTNPATYTLGQAIAANTTSNSGGVITSYSVSPSLPAGLSLNTSTGTVTGTPTAITGTATYTVTGVSSGGNVTASLIITVNDVAPSALTYAQTSPVFTKNSAITTDTVTNSGGTVVSYSVTPSLPSGLSLNTVTGTISGTPTTVTASANYTVTALNTGGMATATLTIVVNDIAPSSLTYTSATSVYTKGLIIPSNTPTSSGGPIISYSVSPALPAGLTLNTTTGVISGTGTAVTGVANYTITATNSGGVATAVLSITVNDVVPSNLVYSADPATFTKGTAIVNDTPTSSGGAIISYSVSPALPSGLSLNTSTGIITGTPTVVSAASNYTITAMNSGGSVTDSVSITVNDVTPSGLSYSSNPATYTKGTAIANNTPTSAGGAVTSFSVSPALPSGLTLNTSTGVISGIPTAVTSATAYTVTALNSGGSTSASVSITVNDVAPSALTYTNSTPTYIKGSAITSDNPSNSGGTVTGYSISPALPTGLSLSATTGVISGTPTIVSGSTTYTVTATNSGGSTTGSVTITVNDVAPSALSYSVNPAVYTKSTAIANNTPTTSGGAVTGYSVSPALPTGLSLNTSTGVISGTPTVVSAIASYTVTATNSGGVATASVSITVNDIAPSGLTYTTNPATYVKGTAIANNGPIASGGSVLSYTVSPSLPSGLSLSVMTGVISGTPTAVTASAAYTITATNSGGSTTASLTITVNDIAPSSLTYSTNPATYTKGTAVTNNTPSNSGGLVTGYSVSPSLPAGLSINGSTGVISGTPTAVSANASYTVTATNSGGNTTASVSITVKDVAPSALTYSVNPATYTKSSAIANNTPSNSGGAIVSYSVSPSLPTGLTLNTSTGVISGTPTTITSTANYTVTATNTGGSTTASVSITVNDVAPSALSYSVNPATYTNGYAITNNTASYSGGSILSFTVSPSLPAGLSLSVMTGTISGTPTAVSATQTYVVTGTNSGGSTTANVSITVSNPTIAVSANNNQTAGARATLPSAFVAIVKDATGTVIANQLVDWAITGGGGSLSSAQNATTAGGLSSSTMTLGSSAGSNTCTATIDGTGVSVTFTATATTSTFTHTFSMASSTGYTYNSNKIDFSNGYAELTPAYQTDNSSNCSTGFGDGVTSNCGGSSTGTAFSTATDGLGSSNYMMLSHAGTATDTELDSTWTPAWPSLVAYWKLNDAVNSGTVSDSSSTGANTGSATSITLGAVGKLNTAATFSNGSNSRISATVSQISASPGAWTTVSFWMKWDGTTNIMPFAFAQYTLWLYGGYIGFNTGYGDLWGTSSTGLSGVWTHIVAEFYNGNVKTSLLFINGVSQTLSQNAGTTGSQNVTNSLGIGYWPTHAGYSFNSQLDDVAVWNTALSASAIATIYQHESAAHAGTLTSRVMDGLSSNSWTTLAATTTLPFGKELPDTATSPSPSPVSESQSSYSSLTANLMGVGSGPSGGIVGLWHLDEIIGTTGSASVLDKSGNGYNGTPGASAVFGGAGKLGTGVSFSGTVNTGYVSIPVASSTSTLNTATSGSYTMSAWANISAYPSPSPSPNSSTSNGVIFGRKGTFSGFLLGSNGYVSCSMYDNSTTNYNVHGPTTVTPGTWHQYTMTVDTTNLLFHCYIDGKEVSGSPASFTGTPFAYGTSNPFVIGMNNPGAALTNGNYGWPLAGSVDEAALWSRNLSSLEVLELYRRGANRIRYQVRSCPDSTCSTSPTWLGPDGSNQTYFSELNNNSIPKDGGDLTTSDSVNAASPTFTFSNFVTASPSPTPFSVPTNRYFQYRAIMESDDTSTSCNYGGSYTATWCSPELQSVAVGPNHYDTSAPTIVNSTGVNFATLTSLLETLGTAGCGSGTLYNLSPDGTNWYYLNGSTWTLAGGTVATATAASLITPSALATFPSPGTIYFKVFLQSSGTSACTINSIAIGGTQ